MSKTKKNNRSPGSESNRSGVSCSRSVCCSSPSPSSSATFTTTTSSAASTCSAESVRLIHNNLHNHHPPHHPSSSPPAQHQPLLLSRMTTVRRLLTIAFLLLLIGAVSLFSLHQIQQILQQHQQQQHPSPPLKTPPQPPPSQTAPHHQPPLPLSKAEPLLYRALLQQTTALNSVEQKRAFIRTMARDAWTAYTRLAWGHEAVRPLTGEPYDSDWFSSSGESSEGRSTLSGRTIVASASSLWLMGLRHEYEQARHWIATSLDPLKHRGGGANSNNNNSSSSFPATKLALYFAVGETLGGLLSCYALTGDLLYLDKAVATASALKPAYSVPGGLLYRDLQKGLQNRSIHHPLDGNTFLWIASQNLEYLYLLELTGACEYGRRVAEMRARIWSLLEAATEEQKKKKSKEEEKVSDHSRSSHLETNYLLHFAKTFRWSAGEDQEAARLYSHSLGRLKSTLRRSRTGLLYVKEREVFVEGGGEGNSKDAKKEEDEWMEADSCCIGSLLALGARLRNGTVLERELALAAALVETCHQAARRSATGLTPARFYFNDRDDATNQYGDAGQRFNFLGPELAEAYFLLYRHTRNGKYQAYAWELAQAIHRHCRAADSGAYTVLGNVEQVAVAHLPGGSPTEHHQSDSNEEAARQAHLGDLLNRQPSYFLGATLKYLYLTFSEEEVLPLEQWTFNAVGQPLPIRRSKVGGSSRCPSRRSTTTGTTSGR